MQAREQLASIVESSGDAIVSKTLDGIIISWNSAAESLFGYAAEEVIGKSITILIPEELHDEEPKILARIRRGDSLDHYETIRQRKDGSRVPVSLSISPVKDAHGTIVGASKIARDITARKRAEHERDRIEGELRELSEKLEQEVERRTLERDRIWNVSEDLLGVANFDGYFLSMNPAWSRLLGWSEDEIKAMHVSALRHPDDAAHSEAGRKQLAQGVPTVRMENRFRHKDGSWRWLHWTMTEHDGLIYVAGRHVTAEKESAAALQHAQRQAAHLQKMEAIGQLTGGVAHDFNNLLMIVSGHAQSLKKRLSETRDVRALQAIEMAATRGENLTRQLLAFSRTLPLNPTVISLADTVAAIRDVLAGTMHVNIEFLIDVPAATWPVCVDKSELELALVNLAVNARDAMPDGGRIAITALNASLSAHDVPNGAAGDYVALSVADTGCGIPADLLPRVVEPFFTTKGPDKGTGLGLSQVYGLAHRSGGTVQIASEIGHGTKVTIYLPRSEAPIAAPSPEDSSRYMAADQRTILVVEDNTDVKNVAVSLLEQLGYKTIAVESASEALDVLASGQTVNLLFTDVALPGQLDGLALARKVTDRYGDHSDRADHRLHAGLRQRSGISGATQAVPDFRARPADPPGASSAERRHSALELGASAASWKSPPSLFRRGRHRHTRPGRTGHRLPPFRNAELFGDDVRGVVARAAGDCAAGVAAGAAEVESLHRRGVAAEVRRRPVAAELRRHIGADVVAAPDHVDAMPFDVERREHRLGDHVLRGEVGRELAPLRQQPIGDFVLALVPVLRIAIEIVRRPRPPERDVLAGRRNRGIEFRRAGAVAGEIGRQLLLMDLVEDTIDLFGGVDAENHIPGACDIRVPGFRLLVARRLVESEVQGHEAVRAPFESPDALDHVRRKILLAG